MDIMDGWMDGGGLTAF